MRGAGEGGEGGQRGRGRRELAIHYLLRLPAPPAPPSLGTFCCGLRLHMLSQIPCKGMRTDSGIAGGLGARVDNALPGCSGRGAGAATAAVQDGTEELGRVGEGL